ncbi:hypothetical protein GCM10009837_07350 [Streptomyces durmitorensis]|uniref:Uncharacterized protein n=1 Tax=Streptomyces durmitorensis TaxID=319947 RepID=A0ABY4PN50_9ACTN|nr:hypothetical protein [Streptomyces durmitorensis]UQT54373.1 hypothetical protein M4V62_04320 [Streptomyces durmitorensis]
MSSYVIPSQTVEYEGEHATVTVALLVLAQCEHGHNVSYVAPDVEDVDHHSGKACHWAAEHVKECTGPGRMAPPEQSGYKPVIDYNGDSSRPAA